MKINGYVKVAHVHPDIMTYIMETEIEIINDEEYVSQEVIELASEEWEEDKGLKDVFDQMRENEELGIYYWDHLED